MCMLKLNIKIAAHKPESFPAAASHSTAKVFMNVHSNYPSLNENNKP
jgi:hypothetical protein